MKGYTYAVYKDGKKVGEFASRSEATTFADERSFKRQKPQVNPNIIIPADIYLIKMIDGDKQIVSVETYTANLILKR